MLSSNVHTDIHAYNAKQAETDTQICNTLAGILTTALGTAQNKLWHGHPVWFLDGNPIVGYSKEKKGIRLMFWSGRDFTITGLIAGTGRFKDASVWFTSVDQIDTNVLQQLLEQSKIIQWDYKNIVKHKGVLQQL